MDDNDKKKLIRKLEGVFVHERDGSSQSEAAEPSAFCVLFVMGSTILSGSSFNFLYQVV